MKAYLVRHGEPLDPEVDPARPLSEKGRTDAEKAARYLRSEEGKGPWRILHSGKLRARETAEIFADCLDSAPNMEEATGLMPGDNPSPWRRWLDAESVDTIIVAHMPFVSRLAALLSKGGPADFRTAQVSCYERVPDGTWGFRWSLDPDDL